MCLCCAPGGACFCGTNDLFRQFGALAWKNRKLKLRYWYVLVAELALPICILFAFSGIKGLLKPVTIPAFLPGAVQKGSFGTFTDGTYTVDTLTSLYREPWPENALCLTPGGCDSTFTAAPYTCQVGSPGCNCGSDGCNLPTPCSSSLAWYCWESTRNRCQSKTLDVKMDLATTMKSCVPLKIAIVNNGNSAAEAVAKDLVALGNTNVGVTASATLTKTFSPFKYFESPAALTACIGSRKYSVESTDACPVISAAVYINSASPAWDYTVRYNQTYQKYGQNYGVPPTKDADLDITLKTNQDTKSGERGLQFEPYLAAYTNNGYLALTDFINSYIITATKLGGATAASWTSPNTFDVRLSTTKTATFPYGEVVTTGFWGAIGQYFALVLIIVLLYPLSNVIAVLVREKESKLREGMMMMAMRSDAMMLSWWLNFVALFLPLSILLTLAGQAGKSSLFMYSQGFYIWIYFFTFFMGSTAFCVLVSCFFTKSRTASIVGSLLFFGGYFIYVGIQASTVGTQPTRNQVLAACLHPAAALTYGTEFFTEYEDAQIGITQFTFSYSGKRPYTFQDIVNMMFIDAFWMSFLAWYVDKIWPSEFGTQKPWYFVFQWSYWSNEAHNCLSFFFGKKRGTHLRNVTPVDNKDPTASTDASVEMVTANLSSQLQTGACVDIQDLYKEFDTPQGHKKVAVNKLNLTMYSGQITALLGHNGAGKTTTIAMLTGLVPPDSGTAIIEGFSIAEDMDEIRRNLGVCPQHDILFPDLSVEEHLVLFASFKGVKGSMVKEEVEKMIQSVGLTEKRHVYSKRLSGGQKRKLSVGIAFIGGSRIVFLDEPTSGMDPYSRRFTWNVIRQHREGRVIVLTTHFMDEADLLGDRIAIMGDGKLVCCGSSLYLKRQYGVGYNMTLEKKSSVNFNTKDLDAVITKRIPEATMLTDAGKEVTYQLPFGASSAMPGLFEHIDENLDKMGLESYGISITTLEEVFIKITQSTHTVKTADAGRKGVDEIPSKSVPDPVARAERVNSTAEDEEDATTWKEKMGAGMGPEGFAAIAFGRIPESENLRYFARHFYALMIKRLLYFQRDKKAWVFTFIVPFAFLLAGMLILKYTNTNYSQPPKAIKTTMYNPTITGANRLPTQYSKNSFLAPSPSPYPYQGSKYCNVDWGTGSYCYGFNSAWTASAVDKINDATKFPVDPAVSFSVYNTSQYLWSNRAKYQASQIGAYTFSNGPDTGGSTTTTCFTGVTGTNLLSTGTTACPSEYILHANFTALHAVPLFGKVLAEGYLRAVSSSSATIDVTLHPFELTSRQSEVAKGYDVDTVVTFLMLAVPFVPAAIATFVVREREVKAKHQQVVSGVNIVAYWVSTFLWDQLTWMITLFMFVVLICGPVFGQDTGVLGGDGQLEACGRLFALLYLFGAAAAGFTYLVSFAFTSPATAQIAMIFIIFISGMVLSIIGIVLRLLPDTRDAFKLWVRYFLCLLPPYALGDGLHSMALISVYSRLELQGDKTYNVTDWEITGLPLMMLGWESAVFLILTIGFEWLSSIPSISGAFSRLARALPNDDHTNSLKDEDVIEEERRVLSGSAEESTILVKDFRKMYSTGKYAVRGVSLGIPNGECFGLLGINGAGKSTTLSMLSGEFPPSQGEGYLAGLNLLTDIHTCRRKIGFCPQFDSLFELLTGREHLELYARIKGINDEDIDKVVTGKIREMGLIEYADRYAGTYSGGNKRKLSVAIAMIGEPSIVFLDEPSTGMDPVARRFMWDVITDIVTKREKCSLILTTHSMEECEALCTRIGIMVGGVLRCLGSAQHLRTKYGDGLQIEIGMVLPTPESIAEHCSTLLKLIGQTFVDMDGQADNPLTREQLLEIYAKLGKPLWAERLSYVGTGNDLHSVLESHSTVGIKHVAQWCLLEVVYDEISLFLATKFGEYIQRERQPNKLRVEISARLPDGSPRLLSGIFGALEGSKGRLQIQEYSIAQTSLEQIFNGFAATQEEEQGPGGPDGAAGSDGRKRAGSAAKAADDGCCKCCEV